MLLKWRVPKTIQWVIKLFFIFLVVFTLFRLSTFIAFKPEHTSFASVLPSFALGILFDVRWICILLLPVIILSFIPKFSPYSSNNAKRVWVIYLALATFFMMFFFGADYGQFAYVSTRVSASALNFKEDASTSMQMLWESYPIVWMVLALIGVGFLFYGLYKRTHQKVAAKNNNPIVYQRKWYGIVALLMLLGVYGSVTTKPLQWQDAFVLKDNFKSYLALNPLENFFTTLRFRKPIVGDDAAKQAYHSMANFLQLDSAVTNNQSFERFIQPSSRGLESKPNIVLVICESFSMYKSSMSGNPLNTTPYFKQMCDSGIFFNRCFTPHFATARGVFATLTGIPDVQLFKFSSRNQESLNQHTIINNFEEYNKHYFIGGSSEFNNYKGLLNNIKNVQLHEEGSFTSPKVNVWGISDKDLFIEANQKLKAETKPFFAVIQTADNHRPFTIPATDKDFIKKNITQDTLTKYGFLSLDEYNAFAYTDYAFKTFIEAAKKENYFNNTIFVFVGDHGVAGNANAMYPACWTDNRLSDEHVPLLFYAPKLLVPQQHQEAVSQIDVLPTIAGLVHLPYTNSTLGRDALNPNKKTNGAFIIHHDEGKIGWVNDSFYFIKNIRFDQELLLPITNTPLAYTPQQEAAIKKRMSIFTTNFYETAKWLLIHNKEK
jgi:phosphoglycerol transferase MdoB-like AlkP superfamily enzyme